MNRKKVFVTGCFDMLHSGHIAFLQEAATLGDVYVCIGADENINQIKGRYPVTSQNERKFMLEALSCIKECRINTGRGIMDFENEINEIKPAIFVVNDDGDTPGKAKLCKEKNIEYKILKRIPPENFAARSTSELRKACDIPFRIDLAGGWHDHPFVNRHAGGPVVTISVEPNTGFNDRSGMSSSTRKKAIELWNTSVPPGDKIKLSKILFCYDNPPGTKDISGSQDALGIVLPGLNYLYYADGNYWPVRIESVHDEAVLSWMENHLSLISLGPRPVSRSVLSNTNFNPLTAKALSDASENCWNAILKKDIHAFGKYFRLAFEAQVAMLPNMVDDQILKQIAQYSSVALGWKLAGAGGGGYLILVSEKEIQGALKIKIRRKEY
ncbi:MAG TPA: adenylyltransferase/cytidyltransferase family protein [Bacteroidia bacterium]|nr:adenylyltransferase/cytidyltransferase family protein [Bacteroidia bacterium]